MAKKMENPMLVSSQAKNDFGAWGWFVIIFAFLSFMIAGNLIIDSLNVTVTAFADSKGWDPGIMLSYSTVAGIIAIIGSAVLSNCVAKYGVKSVYIVCMFVCACCCMVWGSIKSMKQFLILTILVNVFGNGFGFVGSTALIANWFPKKKGLAMGWSTIGFQASAVLMIPAFTMLIGRYNLSIAYRSVGVLLFVMIVVCALFLRNNPEDRSCAPDNDYSMDIDTQKKIHERFLENERSNHRSTYELLRTKEIWQIGIFNGLVQLAVTVLVVQFIPNMINCGFSNSAATAIYSAAAVIGGIGSYLWGVLDHNIGVKKASVWMCIMHAVAAVIFGIAALNIIPGRIVPVTGALIVASILGVSSNYVGSFTATVFGRYGYARAFAIIYMIVCGIRAGGFAIIGIMSSVSGSYASSYFIVSVLSIAALIIVFTTNDKSIEMTGGPTGIDSASEQ